MAMIAFGTHVSTGALHLATHYRREMAQTIKRGPSESEVRNYPKLYAHAPEKLVEVAPISVIVCGR